jgi:hypothetical protein
LQFNDSNQPRKTPSSAIAIQRQRPPKDSNSPEAAEPVKMANHHDRFHATVPNTIADESDRLKRHKASPGVRIAFRSDVTGWPKPICIALSREKIHSSDDEVHLPPWQVKGLMPTTRASIVEQQPTTQNLSHRAMGIAQHKGSEQ